MTRHVTCSALAIFVMTAIAASAASSQSESDDGAKQQQPNQSATAPAQVRLTPFEGFDGDADYALSIAARATELIAQADQSSDLRVRVDLLLAAANMTLARELEPACTGKLLRLADEKVGMPSKQLQKAFDRVDAALGKVEKTLEQAADQVEEAADWIAYRGDRLEILNAFAAGLRSYLIVDDGPDGLKNARKAASGLSILLEHDNPQVVAAATLWQACLRARESDPSRALFVLNLALSEPSRTEMPFAFFARLLRCQILASRGGYVAALALLTQIEDLCDIWFIRDAERDDALRATTFLEIQILRDWQAHLPDSPDSKEKQWCADRIQKLMNDRLPEEQRTLLRLTAAIPIIASPEDASRHNPGAETNPE